jgi:hypothetical protein
MVRVMSENPKFRNSEFFDFMSKVSSGELKFENNEVVAGDVSCIAPFLQILFSLINTRLTVVANRGRCSNETLLQRHGMKLPQSTLGWEERTPPCKTFSSEPGKMAR